MIVNSLNNKKAKMALLLALGFSIALLILKFVSISHRNKETLLGRISNMLNENNKLEVVTEGVDLNKIEIIWGHELVQKIIFKNGKQTGEIGEEYGPNKFMIKIENGKKIRLIHWKLRNWYTHDYKILISKKKNQYKIDFKAIGPCYTHKINVYNLNFKLHGNCYSFYKNDKIKSQNKFENGKSVTQH